MRAMGARRVPSPAHIARDDQKDVVALLRKRLAKMRMDNGRKVPVEGDEIFARYSDLVLMHQAAIEKLAELSKAALAAKPLPAKKCEAPWLPAGPWG